MPRRFLPVVAVVAALAVVVAVAPAPAEAKIVSKRGPTVIARSGPYVAEATDFAEKAASGPYKGLLRSHTVVTYRTAKAPSYGDTSIYSQLLMNASGKRYVMPDSGYHHNLFDNTSSAHAYSMWGCPPVTEDPNLFQADGYAIAGKFPNGVYFTKSHQGYPLWKNCPEPG